MNTTDFDYFYSLPIEKQIINKYESYFTILYIGATVIHKGMGTAISAMPILLEEIPNALLVLVGKGDEAIFKKMVSDKHLDQAVEFVSWQDLTLMPSYITASDVCIMPYLASAHVDTSSPHKLFQYMAMAKPVIVSSAKPMVRIVKETGAGLIYDSGDANGLAEAIIKIYRDKELAASLGRAGQKAVKERYDWQKEGDKLIKLYQDLGGIK
jgi:glycosyltransferase involved in cell wall biosynthesis